MYNRGHFVHGLCFFVIAHRVLFQALFSIYELLKSRKKISPKIITILVNLLKKAYNGFYSLKSGVKTNVI